MTIPTTLDLIGRLDRLAALSAAAITLIGWRPPAVRNAVLASAIREQALAVRATADVIQAVWDDATAEVGALRAELGAARAELNAARADNARLRALSGTRACAATRPQPALYAVPRAGLATGAYARPPPLPSRGGGRASPATHPRATPGRQ
jgi:hypothetical protein